MVRLSLYLVAASILSGATLQKLTLPEMAAKSTEIVLAKVGGCAPELRGRVIYTTCRLMVSDQWKGAKSDLAVSIPGGALKSAQQSFAGAPTIKPGKEFLFFLWTGPSGMTQIIGLSQGLLSLEHSPDGTVMAVRAPVRDRMLDASGRPVWDEGIDIPLTKLRETVRKAER